VTAAGAEVGLAFLLSAPRGGRQGVHFSGGRGRNPADNVGEVGIRIKSPAAGAGGAGVEDGEGFSVQTLFMTVSGWIADREIVFKRRSFLGLPRDFGTGWAFRETAMGGSPNSLRIMVCCHFGGGRCLIAKRRRFLEGFREFGYRSGEAVACGGISVIWWQAVTLLVSPTGLPPILPHGDQKTRCSNSFFVKLIEI
jgi:hypothetical protein